MNSQKLNDTKSLSNSIKLNNSKIENPPSTSKIGLVSDYGQSSDSDS